MNTSENILENGAFAPKEQMLHFPEYFKYMTFQRRQKALLWSKRLRTIEGLFKNTPTVLKEKKANTELFSYINKGITHVFFSMQFLLESAKICKIGIKHVFSGIYIW